MKAAKILFGLLFIILLQRAEAELLKISGVNGVFIQLDRNYATKTTDDWKTIFQNLKSSNIDTIIIQWSAENDIIYFDASLDYKEKYNVLEKIFAVAGDMDFNIYLGLHNETTYWTQIIAPLDVLDNFFYLRVEVNERLVKDLIRKFGLLKALTGYYIPDEIDDLNWRLPERIEMFNKYLKLMVERIRVYDNKRPIAISAFVRSRTSPRIFAENINNILRGTGVNILCVQDGAGENNPPEYYRPFYFEYIKLFNEDLVTLWGVIEVFTRTSKGEEVFAAQTAPSDRIKRQIVLAKDYFQKLVLFSLQYLDLAATENSANFIKSSK